MREVNGSRVQRREHDNSLNPLESTMKITHRSLGLVLGLKAFPAAVLGGFGSIPGAVVGGVLIGTALALRSARLTTAIHAKSLSCLSGA